MTSTAYTDLMTLVEEYEASVPEDFEHYEIPLFLHSKVDAIESAARKIAEAGEGNWAPLLTALDDWHNYDFYDFDALVDVLYCIKTLHDA